MKIGRSIALWLGLLILLMGSRASTPATAAPQPERAQLMRSALPFEAIAEASAQATTLEAPERREHRSARSLEQTANRSGRGRCRTHTRATDLVQRRFAQVCADARRNLPATYGNPPPTAHS